MISSSILRPRAAQKSVDAVTALSSSLPQTTPSRSQQTRWKHTIPSLPLGKDFQANGIKDMLSPNGYAQAWNGQQGWAIARLNLLTDGTSDETANLHALANRYSRSPDHAALFNYASYAHNNHLFFSSLTNKATTPNAKLSDAIKESFTSLESLRATMIASANGMFGPGFTWLVRRNNHSSWAIEESQPSLAILNTYLAGTPYPRAHWRAQGIDSNTSIPGQPEQTSAQVYAHNSANADHHAHGLHSGTTRGPNQQPRGSQKLNSLAPGGQDLQPLLCVNTWEHVWLYDHGIGGKRKYLEKWWDAVDWDSISRQFASSSLKDDPNALSRIRGPDFSTS